MGEMLIGAEIITKGKQKYSNIKGLLTKTTSDIFISFEENISLEDNYLDSSNRGGNNWREGRNNWSALDSRSDM